MTGAVGSMLIGACALAAAAPVWAGSSSEPDLPAASLARRTYAYEDGMVYRVLATPGRITDLVLQPGERLAGAGPLAAGDTARWIIGDTTSGSGEAQRVHVLVKPTATGLATNLIVNTTLRTYHLDLQAVPRGGYPEVRWRYPQEPLVVVAAPPAPSVVSKAVAGDPDLARLNLAYRIKGPRVAWRPVRVFDDGRRTYVEFGPAARLTDLPPLFLLADDGKSVELANYVVLGRRIVIERIIDRAELRLGQGRWARRVRILREASR